MPYTRSRDVRSENLRRRSVKVVEFEQEGATIVSSDGAETIQWDVTTVARKDKVAGQFAFTKATNGRYIVTQKDNMIFVYDTWGGVVNADGEEKVPITFFRAPSPVVASAAPATRLPLAARAAPCLGCTPRGSQMGVRREQGRGDGVASSVSWGVRYQYFV